MTLFILQHPDEVGKAIGTAPILRMGLKNCITFIGQNWGSHPEFCKFLSEHAQQCVLLWKLDKTDVVIHQRAHFRYCLLLDGSWRKAFRMWISSSKLQALLDVFEQLQQRFVAAIPEAAQQHYRKDPK